MSNGGHAPESETHCQSGLQSLPSTSTMERAFIDRDASYNGIFVTAVRTTGIFCKPDCPARKPLIKNVEFYATPREALFAGYRPCLRCRPMVSGGVPPEWLKPLLLSIEEDPSRRWRDQDLRQRNLSPERVRRWFKNNHGMTFQAFNRARRLSVAVGRLRIGESVTQAAFHSDFESQSGFNTAFKRTHGISPSQMDVSSPVSMIRIETPIGQMIACATEERICLLEFSDRRMIEKQLDRVRKYVSETIISGDNYVLQSLSSELDAYFSGSLVAFETPINVRGTPFQERVWNALLEVPYGTTMAYGELAERLGDPLAVRAVARANGDNRIAILIPCHRIIGANGKLTGYGGGLWRKQRLLDVEKRQLGLAL